MFFMAEANEEFSGIDALDYVEESVANYITEGLTDDLEKILVNEKDGNEILESKEEEGVVRRFDATVVDNVTCMFEDNYSSEHRRISSPRHQIVF